MLKLSESKREDNVQYVKDEILNHPGCFHTEALLYQLENPSEISLNTKGQMAWVTCEKVEDELTAEQAWHDSQVVRECHWVFLAPPVLMALCMQRYDLVKGLVEAGYSTIAIREGIWEEELSGTYVIPEVSFELRFSLGQFIMGDPDMPDELRLYLWQQLAKEKKEYSKKSKKRRKKVIDFSDFRFQENICAVLFRPLGAYEDTFFRTLKMIAKEKPRYLKNIIGNNLSNLFQYNDVEFQIKLMQVLLTDIVRTDSQKMKLIQLMYCFFKVPGEYADSRENMVRLYSKQEKYYKENDRLRESFFYALLKDYIGCNACDDWQYRFEPLDLHDKKVLGLLRRFLPKDVTFKRILMEVAEARSGFAPPYIEYHMNNKKLQFAFRLYKLITRKAIVLDSSVVFAKQTGIVSYVPTKRKTDTIHLREVNRNEWLQLVDWFSYDDSEPLNGLQKHILEHCGEDMLIFTMKRGLLRGKHMEAALEYCMGQEELYCKVPCIMAFTKQ